jgi:hypothetical protein
VENNVELKVYLHRTKKQNFKVAEAFIVGIDLARLQKEYEEREKATNGITGYLDVLDFINQGFKNDCQKLARNMNCIKKYGTGYISFMRPQFEGDEKDNGTETIYFDNKEMLFMKRKPKRGRKKKEAPNNEEQV